MERILNFLDKSTNGKCYKSFKYSLDDLEVPSLIYDDKPKIVLQPKAETDKRKQKYISVKEEAEKYKGNSIFKYFLDGSGKSSVSCPLKPSDSTPLKHSTMPP